MASLSETLRNFQEDLQNNKAPDTRKVYNDRFEDLMRFLGRPNPDQFLTMDRRVFEDKVHMYIKDRNGQGKGYSFLNQAVSAIRTFCIANRIDLNFPWLYSKIPKPEAQGEEKEQDKPYSPEQRLALFTLAMKKENWRALCSMGLMYTGGPRIGALPKLRIEQMKYVEENDLYAFLGYPESKRYRYWIITAPWMKPIIDRYKGDRKEGRLFISHRDGEPVTKGALIKEVWNLLVEAKIREPNGNGDTASRHDIMLDHGFRKAHSTELENAGLTDDHIARLRGSKKGLKGIYQLPTPKEIIETTGYMKATSILKAPLSLP